MGALPREYLIETTPDWTLVPEIDPTVIWESLLCENLGESVVEIAFGTTTYPDLTVRGFTTKSISDDRFLGPCYIRHTGGFNSEVILRVWRE